MARDKDTPVGPWEEPWLVLGYTRRAARWLAYWDSNTLMHAFVKAFGVPYSISHNFWRSTP